MPETRTYTIDDIQRYLQHKMSAKEMHGFEKAMMEDPFLADAMEGYRSSNNLLAQHHLEEIKKQITANKQPAKVVHLSSHKTGWWKIAAIIFIIVTGAAISYMLLNSSVKNENSASQIAQTKPEEIPVIKDSIEPAANTFDNEKAPGGKAVTYRKSASPIIRKDPKSRSAAIIDAQSKHDTARLAMTEKMDERTLITNNETASANTALMPEARRSATLSASTANQELKGTTAQSTAPVKSEASAKKITSKKDSNSLDEVVGNDYGTKRQRDVAGSVTTIENKEQSAAVPEGGWKNFDDYVKQEIQSFKDSTNVAYNKTITLEFLINEEGRPTDIQIKQEADKAIADKAIQILKNGPGWKRNRNQSNVNVVMDF
ncbi:MAG: hypothetical protein H0X70_04845 [Segetibacter sp.]|jgi:hypothetical protein|nr:hypothetical protein [Segetibacter sp.]